MADPIVRAHALSAWRANNVVVPASTQPGDVLVLLTQAADTTGDIAGGPAGWTYLGNGVSASPYIQAAAWVKVADADDAGSTVTITGLTSSDYPQLVLIVVQDGTTDGLGFASADNGSRSHTVPSVSGPGLSSLGIHGHFFWQTGSTGLSTLPPGTPLAQADQGTFDWIVTTRAAGSTVGSSTAAAVENFARGAGVTVRVPSANASPNAPILTAPADGATIDRSATQRFDWDFSDPDAGDSQSKYDVRYRLIGDPTWITVTGTTPTTFHDFAAGTFAAGDYEWQIRTYDAQGAVGPYSASGFFTAATPPPAPVITDPINGQTIGAQSYFATMSAPDVDASQWRTVADNAGVPDPTTVHQDSGAIESSTQRSYQLSFPVNNRAEHIQARIRLDGLWSSWYSIAVDVSYTPPPIPARLLTPNGTRIDVAITNPPPDVGEPAVAFNKVFVDDGDGEELRATDLPGNATWTYRTPRSRRDYEPHIRVVAVGDNGTEASS